MTSQESCFATIHKWVLVFGFLLLGGQSAASCASDSTQELTNAIGRMNSQLGSGETAEGWRRFLQLNRLESQAAKGEQADLGTLQELYQRIASAVDSAQFQPFADVRDALANQIRVLSESQNRNISELLQQAASQYRPIEVADMQRLRDVLQFDLQQFQSFQAAQPYREKRNAAFETLRLSDLQKLLAEMEFELAPEISEGKLISNLQDLQQQLRAVTAKIDALPDPVDEEPGPETEQDQEPSNQEPQPRQNADDELDNLRAQERTLREGIRELNTKRAEVRREDLPRKRQRAEYLRQLIEFEDRFNAAQFDLGDPYAFSAQFSLEKFSRLYQFGTEDNLQEDFLKRIERLEEDFQRLTDPNDRRAHGMVGNTLEWLELTSQTPQLVAAIRFRHSLPNAYLHISGQFLNKLGGRPVSESRPVCEEINGRQVTGTAHTNGTVNFDFVSDPDQVHISIRTLNQITSNTQLEQGPLKVFIQTDGQAEARRSLVANLGGLHDDVPYGAANMDSKFCGTSSQCNLINKVASKKFAEAKAEGDVRAASKVRKEMMQKFTEETDKALGDGKKTLGRIQSAGLNFFAFMPAMYLHTTPDQIRLVGKRHSRWNLGAPTAPPLVNHASDIEIRIHDSLLSNYIEPYFRGKTFTNDELAAEMKRILKSDDNPLAPKPKPDGNQGDGDNQAAAAADEPFSITFHSVRPVQFELKDNRIAIVISATRFTRADRTINAGLTITLKFKLIQQNGELYLIRDGKADLDYIEGQEKNAELVAFRSILNGKLNPEGQEETKTKLPANLLPVDKIPALADRPAAKALQLSQCRLQDGWFYVGWNHVPDGQMNLRPVDLPALSTQATATFSDVPEPYYVPQGIQASFGR